MRPIRFGALLLSACLLPHACIAATLFSDNFNTAASSANYGTITSDATSSFPTYAYNYGTMGIPSAPHSGDGSTTGLKLDANFSAPNAAEAVTVYTLASYSGDYTVQFDAWI